jgi:hypothetical protein
VFFVCSKTLGKAIFQSFLKNFWVEKVFFNTNEENCVMALEKLSIVKSNRKLELKLFIQLKANSFKICSIMKQNLAKLIFITTKRKFHWFSI